MTIKLQHRERPNLYDEIVERSVVTTEDTSAWLHYMIDSPVSDLGVIRMGDLAICDPNMGLWPGARVVCRTEKGYELRSDPEGAEIVGPVMRYLHFESSDSECWN